MATIRMRRLDSAIAVLAFAFVVCVCALGVRAFVPVRHVYPRKDCVCDCDTHTALFVAKDVDVGSFPVTNDDDDNDNERDFSDTTSGPGILPMDSDHGLLYLDPLKEFPTISLNQNVHDHYYNNFGRHYRPIAAVSDVFPNTGTRRKRKYAPTVDVDVAAPEPAHPFLLLLQTDRFHSYDDSSTPTLESNADTGTPYSVSIPVFPSGSDEPPAAAATLSCGSYSCTQGGWPSSATNTTAVHWIRDGIACLTDVDGEQRCFGPGDTLVIPRGWSGRWDVGEDLHTVWFQHNASTASGDAMTITINDNGDENEASSAITRAIVIPYQELAVAAGADHSPLVANPEGLFYSVASEEVLYYAAAAAIDDTAIEVSCVVHSASGAPPTDISPRPSEELWFVLEGTLSIQQENESAAVVVVKSGSVLVLPPGWTGSCLAVGQQPVRAIRIRTTTTE